jgi:hypothetical protein
MKHLATFLAGALSSLALILSCDDGAPSEADASCECPVAEAPLAGRAKEIELAFTLRPVTENNGQAGTSIDCPTGGILLSGGCAPSLGTVPDIVLVASRPSLDGWRCDWKNNSNEAVPVRAIARCLMPAQ